jgi:hypothetical protein
MNRDFGKAQSAVADPSGRKCGLMYEIRTSKERIGELHLNNVTLPPS